MQPNIIPYVLYYLGEKHSLPLSVHLLKKIDIDVLFCWFIRKKDILYCWQTDGEFDRQTVRKGESQHLGDRESV